MEPHLQNQLQRFNGLTAYKLISLFGFINILNKYSYLILYILCNRQGGAVSDIRIKAIVDFDLQIKYYPWITKIFTDSLNPNLSHKSEAKFTRRKSSELKAH